MALLKSSSLEFAGHYSGDVMAEHHTHRFLYRHRFHRLPPFQNKIIIPWLINEFLHGSFTAF
jgi:hypothetical protein